MQGTILTVPLVLSEALTKPLFIFVFSYCHLARYHNNIQDYTLLQMWDYSKWSSWSVAQDYDHEGELQLICFVTHAFLFVWERMLPISLPSPCEVVQIIIIYLETYLLLGICLCSWLRQIKTAKKPEF